MKKLISLLCIFALHFTIALPAGGNTPEPATRPADMGDAMAILKHIAGIELLPAESQEQYDFNGNGVVDIMDALEVLKGLAGIVELPRIAVEGGDDTPELTELTPELTELTPDLTEPTPDPTEPTPDPTESTPDQTPEPCECGECGCMECFEDGECWECEECNPEGKLKPLSEELEMRIKEDWVALWNELMGGLIDPHPYFYATPLKYYGTYNGYVVLSFFENIVSLPTIWYEFEIGGVTFSFGGSDCIHVWKDGNFIEPTLGFEQALLTAYNQGLLTQEDLLKIKNYRGR